MSADQNQKATSGLSEKALAFSVDSLLGQRSESQIQTANEKTQKLDETSPTKRKIQMKLCKRDLWCKFHRFGNEMILTKTGRRIFPPLQVEIFDLQPECYYIIWVEIAPMDGHRYKYVFSSSQWMIAGKCDPPFPNNRYYHPDGIATGKHWMSRPVALDKLKLTNNKHPVQKDQMTLRSMHKYQPKIHVQRVDGPGEKFLTMDSHVSESFTFPETSFITVTAYQNQEITKLKIECNRFAKGFRERAASRNAISHNRQERENGCYSTSAFTPIIPSPGVHLAGCCYEPFTSHQALEPVPCRNASCVSRLTCLTCCANELYRLNFCRHYSDDGASVPGNSLPAIQHRTANKLSYHPYLLRTL